MFTSPDFALPGNVMVQFGGTDLLGRSLVTALPASIAPLVVASFNAGFFSIAPIQGSVDTTRGASPGYFFHTGGIHLPRSINVVRHDIEGGYTAK